MRRIWKSLAFAFLPIAIVFFAWNIVKVVHHPTGDTTYARDDQVIKSVFEEMRLASSDREARIAYGKRDDLLGEVWKRAKSSNVIESRRGWRALEKIRGMIGAGSTLDFHRRCWLECRDNPLLFYLAYRRGIDQAIDYYEMAATYDEGDYTWDKISNKDVIRVLYLAKEKIREYNKTKAIHDTSIEGRIQNFIDARARRIFKMVDHLTGDSTRAYDDQLIEGIFLLERFVSSDREARIAGKKWDDLLDEVWRSAKSLDSIESKRGWRALKKIRGMTDAGSTLDFYRRCWLECRNNPLLFYVAYRTGIDEAIGYYEMASMYDNGAYAWDKVSDKEVMRVFYLAKQKIREYNASNNIADTFAEGEIQESIDSRIRHLAEFEERYRK